MATQTWTAGEDEELRRAAIVLRDMCASNRFRGGNYDPEPKGIDYYDPDLEGVDADEVCPGVIVGNKGAAKNALYLKRAGVTHVLNAAEGRVAGAVDASQEFYDPLRVEYKGLRLLDMPQANISAFFDEAADFIDGALKSGGRGLVNCLMGMSRSSTCVLAFLMLRRDMTAVEALAQVRRHRDVRPNDGFLRQIVNLDNRLRRERESRITKEGTSLRIQ